MTSVRAHPSHDPTAARRGRTGYREQPRDRVSRRASRQRQRHGGAAATTRRDCTGDDGTHDRLPHDPPAAQRLGGRGRRADPAGPGRLVRRLGRGVGAAHPGAGRRRDADQARRGDQAQLVPGPHRPRRRRPGRGAHLHLLGGRGRRRRDQQLGRPGRDEGHDDRPLPRLDARSHDVRHPVLHGPARGRRADVRRRDHRQRLRRVLDADHGPDGHRGAGPDGRRRDVRALPALGGRPPRAGPGRRAVAVQRGEVHHPVPRGADDLELRLRLRRQLAARQEVLLAAHRLGDGARRGLARRAHADPQAHLAGAAGLLRRGGVPERVRQDQPRDARADHRGLEGRDPRRRHRLDALR